MSASLERRTAKAAASLQKQPRRFCWNAPKRIDSSPTKKVVKRFLGTGSCLHGASRVSQAHICANHLAGGLLTGVASCNWNEAIVGHVKPYSYIVYGRTVSTGTSYCIARNYRLLKTNNKASFFWRHIARGYMEHQAQACLT